MTRLKHNAIPYDSSNWLLILEDTVWNQQSKIYQKRGCVCEEKTWSLSSYFFFFFFSSVYDRNWSAYSNG